MNIMNMQYSKAHLNMCYFHYLMIYLFIILTFVVCHLQSQQPIHFHRFDKHQNSSYFLSKILLNLRNFRFSKSCATNLFLVKFFTHDQVQSLEFRGGSLSNMVVIITCASNLVVHFCTCCLPPMIVALLCACNLCTMLITCVPAIYAFIAYHPCLQFVHL